MMQRGWVGDVADLFFFSLQKEYSINVDEVGTNHPIFSFFDSPCLRHRVLHNGSSCQLPDGKPNAQRSTSGYSAKRACILSRISFPGDMILRKYLMIHMSKYTRSGSVLSESQGRVILTGIVAPMEKTLFHIREWWPHELRVTATMVSHDSNGATCKSND